MNEREPELIICVLHQEVCGVYMYTRGSHTKTWFRVDFFFESDSRSFNVAVASDACAD